VWRREIRIRIRIRADQIRSDPREYVRSSRKVQERRLVLGLAEQNIAWYLIA
jgi:hypothetical protein